MNWSALFRDHLACTSTLGSIEAGRKAAAEMLKLKPDLAKRGWILIRHYVKFKDIVEWVIKGLKRWRSGLLDFVIASQNYAVDSLFKYRA